MVNFNWFSSLALALTTAAGVSAAANQLVQVNNFGSNPTNIGMFVYKPSKLAVPTPLIVAIHYCSGTAQAYFTGTQFANLADQHGFIVIFPNAAPGNGGCWDVHTNATLTHNAGGDSLGIASQVRYAISNYGVDASQVFMVGSSSGAMMTNVLAGAYPDMFKAGVAFSGVPYACFEGANMWNSACSQGQISNTPATWGNMAKSGYPGYTGARPKMQLWHGTADTTLYYENFGEEVKQWTNVFGVSQTATSVQQNSPASPWTRSSYGANVMALSGSGVGHPAPVNEAETLAWFGLSNLKPGGSGGGSTSSAGGSPTSVSPPSSTSAAPGATQTQWGQCGGTGFAGPTVCASPFTCVVMNAYYSQCQ